MTRAWIPQEKGCSLQLNLDKNPLCHIAALLLWLHFWIASSSNDLDTCSKSDQCLHLYPILHLCLYSPGSRDDSGLVTVFLLTSGIWFHLLPPLRSPPFSLFFHPVPYSFPTPHYLLSSISNVNTWSFSPESLFLFDKEFKAPMHRGEQRGNNAALCSLDHSWFIEACLKTP